MRTHKLPLLAFAAIAALATSCSNDELNDNPNNGQKGIIIGATAGTPQGGADTRLTYTDGTDKMSIVWAAGDQFTACTSDGNYTDYSIKAEDAGKNSASFTASWGTAPSAGTIRALYPAIGSSADPTAITLSMEGQTGALEGLKDFNYMTASTSYTGTGDLTFGTFSHQVAIVKLVLTFPAYVTGTASGIGLTATGLNKSTVLNLTDGTSGSNTAGDVTTGANSITIDGSNQLTAYFCVLPGSLTNAKAIATVGNDKYEAELSNLTITEGNMYTATVTMKELWIEVNGIKVAVGNLVANGANSCKIGAPTDGGLYFQFVSLIGWKGGATGDGTGMPASETPDFEGAGIIPDYDFNGAGIVAPSGNVPSTLDDPARWAAETGTVPAAYDPCAQYLGSPWRLPTKDEFDILFKDMTEFSSTSSPWKWDDASKSVTNTTVGLAFPASGFRVSDRIFNVGRFGCIWSASPRYASSGYNLYFNSTYVDPGNVDDRSYAEPVRCVQSK